jgi:hypothetical protein
MLSKQLPAIFASVCEALASRLDDRQCRRRYFLAYCLGCLLGYFGYWFGRASPGFPWGGPGDFTTLYTGALIFRSGHAQQLYDLAVQKEIQDLLLRSHGWMFKDGLLLYVYPPFFAPLFIPLTFLRLSIAFHFWNLITLGFLLASVRLLLKDQNRCSPREFLIASLVVLAFFPVFESFYKGQSSFLVLFSLTYTYLSLKRGYDGRAGFALAVGLIKPQLVLVVALVLLIQKRRRAIAAFVVSSLLLSILCWILVGTQAISAYFSLSRSAMTWDGAFNFIPGRMPNLRGTIHRVTDVIRLLSGGAQPSTHAMLLTALALSLLVLIWIMHCWKGTWKPAAHRFDLQFAFTIIATLLITPYIYGHDLSLLVLVGFLVFGALTRHGRADQAQSFLATGHIIALSPLFFGSIEGSAQVIMLALAAAMVWLSRVIYNCPDGCGVTATHRD